MSAPVEGPAIAVLDFAEIVRSGDTVVWTQGAGEPLELIARLLEQRHEIGPFRIFIAGSYAGSARAEHADVVTITGLGAVGTNRALCDAGATDVIPCHLSDVPRLMRSGSLRPDVVLAQLAESERGELSFGTTNGFIAAAMPVARAVIAEVNEQAPWTHSRAGPIDPAIVDLTVRTSRPPVEVDRATPTATDRAVAARIASFVEDGATVQLGIGGVPNAVAEAIADRRDLGLHSGVIGDAVVDLIEAGAITNATKAIDAGCSVAGALLGTQRLYRFANENRELLLEPVEYTHSQRVLNRMTGLVAINSAIEVDVTGQVGAEIAGRRYVGTVGGHADFVRGAMGAPRGRSIIGLSSRTSGGVAKIVAQLRSGIVTTSRADADVVVTEFGAAQLRGQPIGERTRRMIAIAHPDDREALEREARELVVGWR
jgi:acyl-CoA hydrolase